MPKSTIKDVISITELKPGKVFISLQSGHILIWNKGKIILINDFHNKALNSQNVLISAKPQLWNNKVWFGNSIGELLSIDINDFKTKRYNSLNIKGSIRFITGKKDGLLLDVFEKGIFNFDGNKAEIINNSGAKNISTGEGHSLFDGPFFNAYTRRGEISILEKNNLNIINHFKFSAENILDIFDVYIEKKEIYLATSNGVFVVYQNESGISSLVPQNKNFNKSTRGIYKFKDGSIFYSSYGGAGYIDKKGKTDFLDNLHSVHTVYPINDNELLIGTEGGFLKIYDRKNHTLKQLKFNLPQEQKYLSNLSLTNYVLSVSEDKTNYLIGTMNGLWSVNKKNFTLKPFAETTNLQVRNISIVGNQILLSTHLGLMIYNDKKLQKIYPKNRTTGVYTHIIKKDSIWLATDGQGLVAIDRNGKILKSYTKSNGLSDDLVYSLEIAGKVKVAGTSNGINLIEGNSIKKLDEKDGLTQNEFNYGASFYDKETNQAYFGGLNGYTVLNMNKDWFKTTKISKSIISELSFVDENDDKIIFDYTYPYKKTKEPIILKPNQNFINIGIGFPENFRNSEQFVYKLNNETWQSLSIGQPVSLAGLKHGDYQMLVKSGAEDQLEGMQRIDIQKLPYSYETWWFKVLMMIISCTITYWFYLNRINKIKKEQSLRSNISSDLHDEVGGLLTTISMQAELIEDSDEVAKYAKKISINSKEAVRALRDIVWSIDARNDNWDSLLAKIKHYGNELFETSSSKFDIITEGENPKRISQKKRQAVYLIIKETLNNSRKHAEANQVLLRIQFLQNQINIEIKDNGKGICNVTEHTGQGLKNLKNRALSIKSEIQINSNNKGTNVILILKRK